MTTAKPAYTASLSFSDGSAGTEFPVYKGTMGPDVIDIRKLYANTGKFTFDPGFMSTGACESAITFIDGDKGELLYRGYAIEDLAQHCDYLDVCHLLLKGELPSPKEKADFDYVVTHHTMLHEQMVRFFSGFRRDAHPMSVLVASVGALAAFYHDSLDISKEEHRHVASIRLISKMPTLVAMAYKYSQGQPFAYPRNKLSYTANFMHLMFSTPCDEYVPNEVLVRALDRILILHADHEQNASTSTVRLAGSSGANPFACIAAGIATLWGPAHGGANEAALVMLEDLLAKGGVDKIGEFIKQVKNKESGVKLMGFGHRVYKNYDPRAALVKEAAHNVLSRLGSAEGDRKLEIAMELEEVALSDEYFVSRSLYPNVDFYTGLIYQAMGFPTKMFTPLFALGRLPGWIAQYREMIADPAKRIGRPRQVYTGPIERHYIAMHRRERAAAEYPGVRAGEASLDHVTRV